MRVRLTRRLALSIDGVDLSLRRVGDVFEVTRHEGELLIAEGWAVQIAPRVGPLPSRTAATFSRATAEDGRRVLTAERLRDIRAQIEQRSFQSHDYRRAEDVIRDEWHDAHARILNGLDSAP